PRRGPRPGRGVRGAPPGSLRWLALWFALLVRLVVAAHSGDVQGEGDREVAKQEPPGARGGVAHDLLHGRREVLGRVHDDLVVQEEDQVRPFPAWLEVAQPAPDLRHPAQRPLRRRALDDEVAREPATVPGLAAGAALVRLLCV